MISKDKVREYRRLKGFSQEKLSTESGLSLRTVQRIEKGTTEGSPHTLQSLANALGVSNQDLLIEKEKSTKTLNKEIASLKLINFSALSVILLPLGNLILPSIFFWKYRSKQTINEMGRKIISFQIIWTLASILLLLVSPFFRHPLNKLIQGEDFTADKMPILMYIALVALNIFITIKTAADINKEQNILTFTPNIL